MPSDERKIENLYKIIKERSITVVCPQCFKSFSRKDKLYEHFRKQKDETHRGLVQRSKEPKKFLESYQRAMRSSVSATELPLDWRVFSVEFIAEHYGDDEGHDSPTVDSRTSSDRKKVGSQEQANQESSGNQSAPLHPISEAATQSWNPLSPGFNQFDDIWLEYSVPTYIDQLPDMEFNAVHEQ